MHNLFYEKFQELCHEKGLSMSAAVGIMGISKGNLSYWRKGRLPKGDVLRRIARFFDVPVDTLVARSPEQAAVEQEELLRLFAEMTATERSTLLDTARHILDSRKEEI
ncbi:MAG: helix-turn-helix domain-containing protein [Acutalibacteraceae bacterium]